MNVVVTAPAGGEPYAAAVDPATGAITVTALFTTAMRFPGSYGFLPATANEAGGRLAALLVTGHALAPGLVVPARPVGLLYVAGEGGDERTVIAVPAGRLTGRFERVRNYTDLPQGQLRQIAHFFAHFRDLEEAGRARPSGWGDVSEARRAILEAAERARRPSGGSD